MKKHATAAALSLSAALCAAFPSFAGDDDKAELCADAEARYVELFGHPSADEDGVEVVLMYKYSFCPAEITVPVGTTVRWVNVDKRTSHSVILPDEPESDRLFPEEFVEYTFLTSGDQRYLCGPHWERDDMIGMVKVEP